jgi:omega-hydroxy-beta-dihydromenaquinone-9 sulfotransferase
MTAHQDSAMHYLQCGNFRMIISLLWENRKRISVKEAPKIFQVLFMSLVLAPIAFFENLFHAKKIANTVIEKPPIFIVGHWRSGTTYLTSIMTQDTSKSYFKAEQTYSFPVFLTLGKFLRSTYNKVMPNKRPMDNMKMGRLEPQEEGFALATLVQESIMHMMSFPSNARFYAKCAFYSEMTEKTKTKLRKNYLKIVKKLTYHTGGKQLILKSPENTCRIDMLLELFPDAKFIHIYRNPYDVFPSTIGMFKKLFPIFSLEDITKNPDDLVDTVVLDIYEKLYTQYLKDKQAIPKENLLEMKYEKFIKDPMRYMEQIYSDLDIEGFEEQKDAFKQYIDAQAGYKTNGYKIDIVNKRRLNKRLFFLFKKFGYNIEA